MKALILAALLSLTACAPGDDLFSATRNVDPVRAWEPYPWNEPEFIVIDLPQEITQLDGVDPAWIPPGAKILACVQEIGPMKRGQACVIAISSDIDHRLYVKVLRHEKAHCRGWEHGQPKPEGEFG